MIASASHPLLQVSQLAKTFTLHQAGRSLTPLRDCSFSLRAGELMAVTGPSGAGKSTVLKCVYRTYLPSAGSIVLQHDGATVDLATADEHRVLEMRTQVMGFVTQFLHALPRQPARRVVAAPLLARGVDEAEADERACAALASLRLGRDHWDLPPATFSGGERQRVNLARALAAEPDLLLLDEPTASLDRASAALVVEAVRAARERGAAILAVFHDPALVAALADQQLVIGAPTETNHD
jgi:alpha-D-ribose 1-methylphosphonate 5-triphosphate synthase subunit PhnL